MKPSTQARSAGENGAVAGRRGIRPISRRLGNGREQRNKLGFAVAGSEQLEAFARAALREIGPQDRLDPRRQCLGWNRSQNLAPQPLLGTAAAADIDVVALDLVIAAGIDLRRQQADIADVVLRAGIGAASK
jgi:hypothetical protein